VKIGFATVLHLAVTKVPFYIAGGALVVWAVLLAFLGLRSPTFPGGAGGQRGVMAISLVLAVIAMGCAVYVK
jgi:hypothetical protein